jgi:hypothetical protein
MVPARGETWSFDVIRGGIVPRSCRSARPSPSFADRRPNEFEALGAVSFGRGTPPRYAITWRRSWRGPHAARLVAAAVALAEEDRQAQREARAAAGGEPFVFRWPLPEPPDGWY